MCLISFALDSHPDYKLILAANRDEFYERPTEVAKFWADHPDILGGRDARAGGTWMAVNKAGKFAAVTNYRDLKNIDPEAKSRGDLPLNFLLGTKDVEEYMDRIGTESKAYNGFNLLAYDSGGMSHFSNYGGSVTKLSRGIYGLSNALLDTPWPKVEKLKRSFSEAISNPFDHETLLDLLADPSLAEDEELPDTGVGYEMEKMLSAICIKSEKYGTCCSTVVTISYDDELSFTERSYPVGDRSAGTVSFKFKI